MSAQDDRLTGRERRDLPEPVERDALNVAPSWRDRSVIPAKLLLEYPRQDEQRRIRAELGQPQAEEAPRINERDLLWAELSSLLDKVMDQGERNLDPDEFCRYHLLEAMFRTGHVYIENVRVRARRRFKRAMFPDEELDAIFTAACLYAMHPVERQDLDQIETDRLAAEAAARGKTTDSEKPADTAGSTDNT